MVIKTQVTVVSIGSEKKKMGKVFFVFILVLLGSAIVFAVIVQREEEAAYMKQAQDIAAHQRAAVEAQPPPASDFRSTDTPWFPANDTGFQVEVCAEPARGQVGPFPFSRFSGVGTIWINNELVAAEKGRFCAVFPVLTDKPVFEVRLDLERKEVVRRLFYRYRTVRDGTHGEWNLNTEAIRYMDGLYKFGLYGSSP